MLDRGCCQRRARASARRPAAAKRCSYPPGIRPVVHRFHRGLLPMAQGLPLRFDTDASVWCFATTDDRAWWGGWWGGLWAERMTDSAIARQAVTERLANEKELREIAAG